MAFKTIKAKDLRKGDEFAHPSMSGFVVVDIAKHHDQVALVIRAGIHEDTLTLYTNQPVDIYR